MRKGHGQPLLDAALHVRVPNLDIGKCGLGIAPPDVLHQAFQIPAARGRPRRKPAPQGMAGEDVRRLDAGASQDRSQDRHDAGYLCPSPRKGKSFLIGSRN